MSAFFIKLSVRNEQVNDRIMQKHDVHSDHIVTIIDDVRYSMGALLQNDDNDDHDHGEDDDDDRYDRDHDTYDDISDLSSANPFVTYR
ncbi:unnamed protein product [Angiostrongylus costaricensis]|uniref:CPXV020 protein n=1 Tax=Angiostrongylus costaricensis TaxID=334426 RepID=A0A0R3PE42_ANGCS|nr:unnamed protein product [Angiostrongylus costaricensis]